MAELRVTALSLSYSLLDAGARAGLPDGEDRLVAGHADSDLDDFMLARALRRLRTLRRRLVEAARVACSALCIDMALAGHGVRRGGRRARLL